MLSGLMDMDIKPLGGLGLQTGVSAFWSLENTSWLDDTGNGNTLTPSATPPTIVSGVVGNAANFVRASSEQLSIATNSFVTVGTGSFSLQCWVKVAAGASGWGWFAKNVGQSFGNNEWEFFGNFTSARVYAFNFVKNGTNTTIINTTTPVDTAFHHLVATFDGTTVSLYLDAGAPFTVTPGGTLVASTLPLTMGNSDATGFGDAAVDQCGIWKGRVLSVSDISHLYNGGAGLSWAAMA
jgi:hypothetical protein